MSVYILHADKPLMRGTSLTGKPLQCGHYTGYALDFLARLFLHEEGKGARLTQVWALRGIKFSLGRLWEGADRSFERRVKHYKNAPLLCLICNPKAMNYLNPESVHGTQSTFIH